MVLGSAPPRARTETAAGRPAEQRADERTEADGTPLDPAALSRRGRGLLLVHGLLDVAPLRELAHLLRALAVAGSSGDDGDVAAAYGALFRALLDAGVALGGNPASAAGDPLRTGIAHAL